MVIYSRTDSSLYSSSDKLELGEVPEAAFARALCYEKIGGCNTETPGSFAVVMDTVTTHEISEAIVGIRASKAMDKMFMIDLACEGVTSVFVVVLHGSDGLEVI